MRCRAWLSHSVEHLLPADPAAVCAAITALPTARLLARSRTTESVVSQLPGCGAIVRKSWIWPETVDRLKGVLRTTVGAPAPAVREYRALGRLRDLDFAPEPLAACEEREHGLLRRCHLLLREVADATDLAHWLQGTTSRDVRRHVLTDLARRTREMHDAGLLDRDLHLRNVLVDPAGPRTLKVDCGRQRVTRGPVPWSRAAFDLACIDVGLARLASRPERARFLATYLGGHAQPAQRDRLAARIDLLRLQLAPRESRRLPPGR